MTVASLHHFSQHHKGLSQIHNNIFPPRGTVLNTEHYFLFVLSYVSFFQQWLSEIQWQCIIVALFSYFSQPVGRGTSFFKYHCVGLFIFLLDPVQIIVLLCPPIRFSLTKRWKGQWVYFMSVLRFYHFNSLLSWNFYWYIVCYFLWFTLLCSSPQKRQKILHDNLDCLNDAKAKPQSHGPSHLTFDMLWFLFDVLVANMNMNTLLWKWSREKCTFSSLPVTPNLWQWRWH